MDATDDKQQAVRLADGKLPGETYDDTVKRRARAFYALGDTIPQISVRMDLSENVLNRWKQNRQPDGQSWDAVREAMDVGSLDTMLELVGPQTDEEFAGQLLRSAQKLLALTTVALDNPMLYDETGKLVEYLWDDTGKAVPLTIRPTSATQLATLLKTSQQVIQSTVELKRQGDQIKYRRAQDRGKLYQQCFANLLEEIVILAKRDGLVGEAADRLFALLKQSVSSFNPEGPDPTSYDVQGDEWKLLEENIVRAPGEAEGDGV